MSEVQLVRTGEDARKGSWILFLDEDEVVLTDPYGDEVTSFPACGRRPTLPPAKFPGEHQGPGVVAGGGEVLGFRTDTETVREIRSYLDRALCALGPEAVRALRTRGWLLILGGFAPEHPADLGPGAWLLACPCHKGQRAAY